jgi:hypothetical protein
MATLSLNDVVNIAVQVSPTAVAAGGYNLGLIVGSSAVIAGTAADRVRIYTSPTAMVADGFTTNSAEYLAAQLYFNQSPAPIELIVGRYVSGSETALAAVMACRAANTDWYAFTVCGATAADIFALAAWAESAQPAAVYMVTTSDAGSLAGTATAAGYETGAAGPSTDIHSATSPTFKIAVDTDTYDTAPSYHDVTLVPAGLTTGALIAAAMQTAIRALGGIYSAVTVAYTTVYTITSGTKGQGSAVRVANGTTNDVAATLKIGAANGATDTGGTGSLLLSLQALGYTSTMVQYSTTADAVAAIMGYAMGANTGAANSAYTLFGKSEIGVTPEALTASQVATLKAANGNVYINRGTSYNLFEQGVMVGGQHFDVTLGLDQLANAIQIAIMNLIVGSTKVPQTEGGMALLFSAIDTPCRSAVNSGFLGTGTWTAAPILDLATGDSVQGYRILANSMASQSAGDRAARKAPPIYVPIKLAGAIENIVLTLSVNQ